MVTNRALKLPLPKLSLPSRWMISTKKVGRANVIRYINGWVPDTTNPILQPHTKAALDQIAEDELAGIPRPQPQTAA